MRVGMRRWRRRGWPRQSVRYADARIAGDIAAGVGSGRRSRAKPGEFAADELALMLAASPTRCVAWSPGPAGWLPPCRRCGRRSDAARWTPTRCG